MTCALRRWVRAPFEELLREGLARGMSPALIRSMTNIEKLVDNTEEHRFELPLDGHVAFIEYTLGRDRITLTHTEVPEELEGQGIGGRLVKAALMDARERNLKVVPMCRFVAGYINRHREFLELVPEDRRELLGDD